MIKEIVFLLIHRMRIKTSGETSLFKVQNNGCCPKPEGVFPSQITQEINIQR
jgi:hypothetical protein